MDKPSKINYYGGHGTNIALISPPPLSLKIETSIMSSSTLTNINIATSQHSTSLFDNLPSSDKRLLATCVKPLYTSEQVYTIEKAWFEAGYDSFGLMQQAAWQMTQSIVKHAQQFSRAADHSNAEAMTAVVWVGAGNNGGDGWLIAQYLQQAGWQVYVVDVGVIDSQQTGDAAKARKAASQANLQIISWPDEETTVSASETVEQCLVEAKADYHIDALFGIGLDRAPSGRYRQAIELFNAQVKADHAIAVAVDIPSGLVASTGQVFSGIAVQANLTLCLVAAKLGLYIKDAMDYSGQVIDIALIPYLTAVTPSAWRLERALPMPQRQINSHKGSYGHVLIIGGRQSAGSQGMGGAAILSTGSALVSGAGKVTTACDRQFHGAIVATHPNAMTVDIEDQSSVEALIASSDVVAIGMGLGRDEAAASLFSRYLRKAIEQQKPILIDADALYHLADLPDRDTQLFTKLKQHTQHYQVCFTPHSGEAARLLQLDSAQVESDRLAAIHQCVQKYGGDWLLKGAGSLVYSAGRCYVCSVGNPGMASAGMGDVLSGLMAGLMAQQDLAPHQRSLYQAVLLHGQAADLAVGSGTQVACVVADLPKHATDFTMGIEAALPKVATGRRRAGIGARALQAQDLLNYIDQLMQALEY